MATVRLTPEQYKARQADWRRRNQSIASRILPVFVSCWEWDAKQMKGEHPNAQYAEFHRLQVSEMGRPLGMPVNASAGDSSTYSFASGKLDMLLFWRGIDVDRGECDGSGINPSYSAEPPHGVPRLKWRPTRAQVM